MDSILIISADKDIMSLLKNALHIDKYKVYQTVDKDSALVMLKTCFIRSVIINIQNSDQAQACIEYFNKFLPHMAIIIFEHHLELAEKHHLLYADRTNAHLITNMLAISILYTDTRLAMQHCASFTYTTNIIAHSTLMKLTLSKLERAYADGQTVMLCGENGSGLSTLAHYVHLKSNRDYHRFYEIDCRQIHTKEGLIKALMGNTDRNDGPFFLGLGGTIVLDHLDSLEISLQATLLQLFSRIASSINLKIISIVSANIRERTDKNTFKYPLYEKLASIFITIPPLRDRPDDIIPLTRFFAHPYYPEITMNQQEMLMNYTWPGNLTELRYTIKQMLINNPHTLNTQYLTTSCNNFESTWDTEDFYTVKRSLLQKYCRYLTTKYEGNQTKAAKHAGIDRSTFYRCMNGLGKLHHSDHDQTEHIEQTVDIDHNHAE